MRRIRWLLICCLALTGPRALALEFFGDVLYWQATEPVDWAMNTNRSSTDQFVAFKTLDFDFATGFRVGVGVERDWGAKLYYTRFYNDTEDSATGYVTPNFLGSRLNVPKQEPPYYESGNIEAAIDYNVLDLDLSKSFCPSERWQLRPVLGLRGAWINQTYDTEFRGTWQNAAILWQTSNEHIENKFWGIGPKLGIENTLNLWRGQECKVDLAMNFYAAYLLGFWNIHDSATNTNNQGETTQVVPIDNRDFGALAFQAMIGLHVNYRNWNATAGYEFNDWLNQCQIFDDATGPHNNDLIVQGLSARLSYSF
jgi:hypothetical protein